MVGKVEQFFLVYDYCSAKSLIESFFLKEYCDNYLELVKARAYKGDDRQKQSAICSLSFSLSVILRLFAPFFPYVTEVIYSAIFDDFKSIHQKGSWPICKKINEKTEVNIVTEETADDVSKNPEPGQIEWADPTWKNPISNMSQVLESGEYCKYIKKAIKGSLFQQSKPENRTGKLEGQERIDAGIEQAALDIARGAPVTKIAGNEYKQEELTGKFDKSSLF